MRRRGERRQRDGFATSTETNFPKRPTVTMESGRSSRTSLAFPFLTQQEMTDTRAKAKAP